MVFTGYLSKGDKPESRRHRLLPLPLIHLTSMLYLWFIWNCPRLLLKQRQPQCLYSEVCFGFNGYCNGLWNFFFLKTYDEINKNVECKMVNIFLPMVLNICFGCSNEPSHLDGSFEYQQHMFWLRNMKLNLFTQPTFYENVFLSVRIGEMECKIFLAIN